MSYILNKEYRVLYEDNPCSLSMGSYITINEVIPEKVIPEKYKIDSDLPCDMSFTRDEIERLVGKPQGGGNRRSKRKRCRSKRKKRSKRRSKRSKK